MNAAASVYASPNAEFAGKRILITGATGSVGRTTARILSESGAQLVLSGRDPAKLEKIASDFPAHSCITAPYDLKDCDGIPSWMRGLAETGGPFSGVVHAAGMQVLKALRMTSADFVDDNFHVNVTGAIMLAKGFRQKSCHTDDASLVILSSTAAMIGGGGNVAYSSSKAGVISAARAMAGELLRDKIRVNCVVSGLIESDMSERARRMTPAESWQVVLSGYPLGIGKPEDVAYAVAYLLSQRSRWVTGSELQIDGGLSIV